MKLAVLLAIIAAFAAAQVTATVEGVVINKVTGAGIEGVTVWLWSSDTNSYKAITNESGSFHVFGLTPGDYFSRAEKSGYSSPNSGNFDLLSDPPKRHIVPGAEPVRFRFELIPPAILRGRVIGSDGSPARATVDLGQGQPVSTDAEGGFAFQRVWPGTYVLLVRPIVAQRVSRKDEIRTEPVPTYYPSVVERSDAQLITVRAGAELNGYEIHLQSAEVHRVRGVVLDPDGKPAAKAVVQLQPRMRGFPFFWYSISSAGLSMRGGSLLAGLDLEEPFKTAEDGVFEFPSVRAGEWTLSAQSEWIPDAIQHRNILHFGHATFRLEHENVDDLKVQFTTTFSLDGTVALSDGSPLPPGVSVVVTLFSENLDTGGGANSDASGSLRFDGLISDAYQIRMDVRGGSFYADSIWLGSANVTGQSVELTPASPPIKIVLKPAGTLRGTTEEAKAGTVLFFPQNLTVGGYLIQSGAGGTFELAGIPPGNYYAIALDKFDPGTMGDIAHLRDLIPRTTSVRVEQGSTASVQLKVNHAPE